MLVRCPAFKVTLLLLLFTPLINFGQSDTIWIQSQSKQPFISHVVRHGETLLMLAGRFQAPPAAVAKMNSMNYQEGLAEGSLFRIPIDKYNYLRINSVVASRPIYYKVQEGQRLKAISRLFHVSQSTIQRWNKLPLPEVFSGQSLLVGWVRFDSTQKPFAVSAGTTHKIEQKMAEKEPPSTDESSSTHMNGAETALGLQFHKDNQGKELQEASGATVFFTTKSTLSDGLYYAFFDGAPRGTVLSIYNPSGKKYIYAKVIGPLPKIGKYHNAVLGLSANAAKDLNAKSARIFCKIKY